MTTQAQIGHGTTFQINTSVADSPDSWVTIAEVVSVTPPSLSRDAIDATHSTSPNKWREFIPGLRDGGEVTLEVNFIPAGIGTSTILATFTSDDKVFARINFPDSPVTTWEFQAFITAFEPDAPFDDKMSATVTFKLSGEPDFL